MAIEASDLRIKTSDLAACEADLGRRLKELEYRPNGGLQARDMGDGTCQVLSEGFPPFWSLRLERKHGDAMDYGQTDAFLEQWCLQGSWAVLNEEQAGVRLAFYGPAPTDEQTAAAKAAAAEAIFGA